MTIAWHDIILDAKTPELAWQSIFDTLLDLAIKAPAPDKLHKDTVVPDRLLSEAAWNLWYDYPRAAPKTSVALKQWCDTPSSSGKAVLILDALSLRELPLLLAGGEKHGAIPLSIGVKGSQCPSSTTHFAKALGLPSRSALANDGKPESFTLFDSCFTNVLGIPFEDCAVPPMSNLFLWHSWLDDMIHLYHREPDQVIKNASSALLGDGFWTFANKLRQGRKLVITSDHGYAMSRLFSSNVDDKDDIRLMREKLGASRYKSASEEWNAGVMPPLVMTHDKQNVVMGQWRWDVQGGFPHMCHGGMSLLEVAVPFVEFSEL